VPANPPIADWTGRVAWLLGASTGIGLAVAQALHGRGATVVVSARSAGPLEAFAARHPGAHALPVDVTDRAALQAAADALWARHGRVDFVLCCAGMYQPMQATAFDLDAALQHQAVNVGGALHLLGAVLPRLIAQAGAGSPAHLSLVASVAGYRALPKALAYGPTKAALIHLAGSLHLDLAPHGVGVSLVNPGFVRTPLTAGNDFHMPALVAPAEAAEAMLHGWARGAFEIHFPRRFTLLLKALRWLPTGAYESFIRRATGL
jgi:NAD(P)-dependent dehydrogenase (short-subunit alcohol dehydrogenase family)